MRDKRRRIEKKGFPVIKHSDGTLFSPPAGSWDLGTGLWHPNPLLKMTAAEQYAHNVKWGHIKERDTNER